MSEKKIAISVDFKKNRIRIYKLTLTLLGAPKYIQLLINPDKLIFAINPVDKERPGDQSHKINLQKLHNDTYEIYSQLFTEKINELCPTLEHRRTYRFVGKYCEEKNIAVFSLRTAQLL